MQGAITDGIEGCHLISSEDGLCMLQVRNNSVFDLFVTHEKTQDFKNKGIQVPANTQWPINGPEMFLGDYWFYSDSGSNRTTFAVLKSHPISFPKFQKGW